MSAKITEIINAKSKAGNEAYLWLHHSGDCILWSSELDSQDDDGLNALARWTLSASEITEILSSGYVDENA